MARQPTALLQAIEYLRGLLDTPTCTNGARLPTIQTLAHRAGVSPRTMWRAVRMLAGEDILEVHPRRGIHVLDRVVGTLSTSAPARQHQGPKWVRVRRAMERDLAQGRYPWDTTLPSVKQLCARYGACRSTLRKVLTALAADGVLTVTPQGYAPRPMDAGKRYGTILLMSWALSDDLIAGLQSETTKAGAHLRVASLFPRKGSRGFQEVLRAMGSASRSLLGIIVSITGGTASQYFQIIAEALTVGVPVAVIDTTGGASRTRFPADRLLQIFSIADFPRPGVWVGRYLVHLGHRRIAYICPQFVTLWSKERYAGLVQSCTAAGCHDAVIPFGMEGKASVAQAGAEARRKELGSLVTGLKQSRTSAARHLGTAMTRVSGALIFEADLAAMEEEQVPLMERALVDHGITAWVGSNDRVALNALDYLRDRKVRVPHDISVVGFDDVVACVEAGLTSYNFNLSAAIHAALGHILGGLRPARPGSGTRDPVFIDGFVNARTSTGVPRGGAVS